MRWVKQGRIYVPPGDVEWAQAYAFPPTPVLRPDGTTLRLYLAFCDSQTRGRIGWVDVRADDPSQVLGVSAEPVLDIGEPGMFDENGILPTSVIAVDDAFYMYYVGYQLGYGVTYYQFEGLAISRDGGETFERERRVPVTDRSDAEPLNRTSAFVRRVVDGSFQMWYVGGDRWTVVDGKPLPVYNMRYLESADGIEWGPEGEVCLDFDFEDEHAFGRPWVWEDGDGHLMMYSVRTRSKDYRLGLARSTDGRRWERHDDEVGIDVSAEGWDSEMIAYSAVFKAPNDETFLFYNGNERGKTGFGFAVLEQG